MSFSEFKGLRLAGGTALALQIGHRISVDLGFFGKVNFYDINLPLIFQDFNSLTTLKKSDNINIFVINDIKVDFVNYSYPWLKSEIIEDRIRLANLEDIAAMKIAAITGRGTKKDFVDLYFLLMHFNLSQILSFFEAKYFDASKFLALKSLSYFDDAENEPDCNMIIPVEWSKVKEDIKKQVKNYLNNV